MHNVDAGIREKAKDLIMRLAPDNMLCMFRNIGRAPSKYNLMASVLFQELDSVVVRAIY